MLSDSFSVSISVVALIVSIISLILYYRQMKLAKPNIVFVVSKGYYEALMKPEIRKERGKLRIVCDVIFKNNGNADGSITDIMFRTRFVLGQVDNEPRNVLVGGEGRSLGSILHQMGAISGRPTNFENTIPIEIGPYGSKKATFVFEFNNVYPYYIDRCYLPIDPDNPDKKTSWEDLPIVAELTVTQSLGIVMETICLFRSDQPDSKRAVGFMNQWEEIKRDLNFAKPSDE